jgi:hypothetical protein
MASGLYPATSQWRKKTSSSVSLMPDFDCSYYLLTRKSLKNVPRVKAFNKFIVSRASMLRRLQRKGHSGAPSVKASCTDARD